MKSYKKMILKLTVVFLVLAGSFLSCKEKGDNTSIVDIGIIKYYPPGDNCNAYMIEIKKEGLEYSKLYKPNGLPKEFEVDDLQVKVTYRISGEKHNCGFGGYVPIINIIKIQKQ